MKIGIIGAMPQEIDLVRAAMTTQHRTVLGGNSFYSGSLHGCDVVLAFSRCGKAAAASTVTTLFHYYAIDFLLFTGVAGAVDPQLNIGDVVIARALYQHDIDAGPMFPRFEVPLTQKSMFYPRPQDITCMESAVQHYLANITSHIAPAILDQFAILQPKATVGIIATGDQFVRDTAAHAGMHFSHHERAHAVEMEGAAVAQICEDYDKPYVVVRTISDKADHSAAVDFPAFIENVSNPYSHGIVQEFLKILTRSYI